MKYYYIYKITNIINNKIYIGKRTTNKKPEQDTKYFGSGLYITRALKKYGKQNFTKEILEQCTFETLNEREKYYIELYNSRDINIGYNIIEGGYGVGNLCLDRKTYYNPQTDEEIRIKQAQIPPKGFIHGRRPFKQQTIDKMARPGSLNGMYGTSRIGKENPYWGITTIINKQTGERVSWHKKTPIPKDFDYCPLYYKKIRKLKRKINNIENKIQQNKQNINLKIDLYLAKKELYEYQYGMDYKESIEASLQKQLEERLKLEEQKRKKFVKERYKKRQFKKQQERKNQKEPIKVKKFKNRLELKQLWSEQRKQFWKTKPIETCPYCGKQGRGVGFYRWHMQNCRNHPLKSEQNRQYQRELHNNISKQLKGKRPTTLNKICINNGIHNKFIYKEDLYKYPNYIIGKIKKK